MRGRCTWGRGAVLVTVALAVGALALAAPVPSRAATAAAATAAVSPPPERIVSLNLCTDQILLDLVPRARIRALSHLAADPSVSAAAAAAAGLRATRGDAEDVLALDPDLVVAGAWSTPAAVQLLERLGRRVVKVGSPVDLDGVRRLVRDLAETLGVPERGAEVLRTFNRRIGAIPPPPGQHRLTALVYQVNGIASGTGSLADAVLRAAGFDNHAAELGLGAGGALPLEQLVASPPDLLVLSGTADEYRTAVAATLRHPALVRLEAQVPTIVVPWRLWLCGTPHVAEAVELLAVKRQQMERGRPRP